MFTLLRNFRAMFMLTVANYQETNEGPALVDAAVQDEKLNLSEIKDLSDLPAEMQATILEKMGGQLELTTDIASQLGDVTPDSAEGNDTMAQQKVVQFIIKLNQLTQGSSNFLIDGRIGGGSIAALKSIVPTYDGGVITQAVMTELITATNAKLVERVQAAQAAIAAETAEAEKRQSNLQIVAGFDWENKADASVDEIKALQQALQDLGKPVNTIDGVITPRGATEREYNAIQGEITAMEREVAEQDVYNATPGQDTIDARANLERNYPQVEEIVIAIPEQSEINDYSRKSISEMNKYEREAVQRDINAILASMGEELIVVDGGIGTKTRDAMEKVGVYNPENKEYNLVSLVRIAQVSRNGSQLESSLESANRYQALRQEADSILSSIALDPTEEELSNITNQLALLTDVPDDDNDGKDDWTEQNKTRRLALAQYITDKASRMVDAGTISNIQASNIIEGLLAQEKFESKPGRDAISRMVRNTMDEITSLTRNEAGQEVAANFSADAAINAILRSNEPMSMGVSLDRGFFRIAGQNYDIDRAEDMYIVTGNGIQRVGMRDTAACKLSNVSIVGNTIVALMENGCEGNVVYIPLDVNTVPKPPRAPRAPRTPNTPRTNIPPVITTIPEEPTTHGRIYPYGKCEGKDRVTGTYNDNGTRWNPFDDIILTREVDEDACDTGGGEGTPSAGEVSTSTGTEGGGDEGGGNNDADAGAGNDAGRG